MAKFFRRLFCGHGRHGYSILEYMLALRRAKVAQCLIGSENHYKSVLDIGCGRYPIFLLTSKFISKYGIEKKQIDATLLERNIIIKNYQIEKGARLDFADNALDVVTLLAVLEHCDAETIVTVLQECFRVLKPGGKCIVTIPSPWSECLIRCLAFCGLLSRKEVNDHKTVLSTRVFMHMLGQASFKKINQGYFEAFLNRWFVGIK